MRLKYGIFVIVILLFLAGCNNDETDHQTAVSEDVVIDTGLEEVNVASVSENEPEISLVYVENYLEEEGEIIDFLKEYFMISSKEDLEVLTQLPLTESFFDSCLDDFDYLDEVDEIRFVYVAAWLATEENVYECLVQTFDTFGNSFRSNKWLCAYSVKITLIGNQIDQVSIETIGWDGENRTDRN